MGTRTACLLSFILFWAIEVIALGSQSSTNGQESCRYLSLKCSYRGGCGATLRSYLLECNDLIKNKTEICSESCKYTLIGLTSTPEGKSMLDCDCGSDEDCLNSRYRLETCSKDSVLYANRQDTVVSCTEAKWICMSDSECSKALEYYNIFCKSMFRGSKCTPRCRNSIAILKKQSKAAKLESCFCDSDDVHGYKCSDIKQNMRDLCQLNNEQETDSSTEREFVSSFPPPKKDPEESIEDEETIEEEDLSTLWTTEKIDIIEYNDVLTDEPPSIHEDTNRPSSSSIAHMLRGHFLFLTMSVIPIVYKKLIGL